MADVLVTTSWDDGHILDVKLAALLKQYGVRGTFYVSPRDREFPQEVLLTDAQVRELSNDFEIGAHTMTHPVLPSIDPVIAEKEIVNSKTYLENVLGKPVRSFCYPRGAYRTSDVRAVKEAGFRFARTVQRFKTVIDPKRPFTVPTSIHAYDHFSDVWGVLKLARFNPFVFWKLYHDWAAQAIALFDQTRKRGGIFHLWGHSWEVALHNDWRRLEEVIRYIGNHPDVRYVTNSELL